jgi:hypothetical protein
VVSILQEPETLMMPELCMIRVGYGRTRAIRIVCTRMSNWRMLSLESRLLFERSRGMGLV